MENTEQSVSKQIKNWKSKSVLLLIIVCIIGLLLIVFIFFKIFSINFNESENLQTEATTTPLTTIVEKQLQEQIAPLIASGDMSACDSITDKTYKTVCINNIALNQAEKTGDIKYCQYLDNVMIPRTQCEYQVVFKKSIDKDDIGVCMEATDVEIQKYCTGSFVERLAMAKNDITLCDQATDANYCRGNFALVALMQNPAKADCSLFEKTDEQAECMVFKELFVNVNPDRQKMVNICQTVKTAPFKQICAMVGSIPPQMQKITQ